jgi:hypothetical protein
MNARTAATISAGFHVQYGISLMLMPERNAAVWVGRREARRASVKALAQALGARDFVLGAGALLAMRRDQDAARKVFASMIVTDGVDAIATALAGSRIPLPSRIATIAFATGCTVADALYVASTG